MILKKLKTAIVHLFALLLNFLKFLLDRDVDRDCLPDKHNCFHLFGCYNYCNKALSCQGNRRIKVQRRKATKLWAFPVCVFFLHCFVCLFVLRGCWHWRSSFCWWPLSLFCCLFGWSLLFLLWFICLFYYFQNLSTLTLTVVLRLMIPPCQLDFNLFIET